MEVQKIDVAIIMCTWKRPERLKKTLELLSTQKNNSFIFCIWNNNKEIKNFIDDTCNEFSEKHTIMIKHSNENIGGIGRFYFAKEIMNDYKKIIFIDDDQEFNNDMINYFLNHYDENAVKSRWAFQFGNRYQSRKRIFESNVDVGYCGTGGMILPSKVFSYDELYNIPKKYLFIEDLWLCYIANHHLKMKLKSIGESNDFIFQVVDGKDQSTPEKVPLKNEFLNYLRVNCGWKIKFNL